MTIYPYDEGQPVAIRFAGRRLEGVVKDVRWRPSWNNQCSDIVVDADGATITTGRENVHPR